MYELIIFVQGSKIAVVDANDLIKIIALHPGKKRSCMQASTPYVQLETSPIAVQMATNPSEGQCLLQKAFESVDTNEESRKNTTIDMQRMVKVSPVMLKELLGFENMDFAMLNGSLRQLCQGYIDNKGNLIGGRFITVDVVAVVLFDGNLMSARQWLNNLL